MAYADANGVLHLMYVHETSGATSQLAAFQLHNASRDPPQLLSRPLQQPWHTFELLPGAPGELLLVQKGGREVLRTSLPRHELQLSEVQVLGSHQGAHMQGWQRLQQRRRQRRHIIWGS